MVNHQGTSMVMTTFRFSSEAWPPHGLIRQSQVPAAEAQDTVAAQSVPCQAGHELLPPQPHPASQEEQ